MGGGESGVDGNTGGGDSGSDGGGGSTVVIPPGGGSTGYDNTSGSFDFQSVVNENVGDSFQEADKLALIDALKLIVGNETGIFIINMMVDKDIWMKFEINTAQSSPAICDPANDQIVFNSSEAINSVNLSEELIHAVQKSIYGKEMVRANPNYEFEAKIIRDVISGTCNEQSRFTIIEDRHGYVDFIYGIKESTLNESEVIEQYRYYYSKWNDPDGIKQNISPNSPYYYENGENNTFDTQVLKMALEACKKSK